MDKSWIRMPRTTKEYLVGLNQFLEFAFKNGAIEDRIKCPCPQCCFGKWQTRAVVFDHLICKPFPQNYVIWVMHGETTVLQNSESREPRFFFETTDLVARRYVYNCISKKWSANRLDMWEVFSDPLKSKTQIMDNVPPGIPRDQWTSYVNYRYKKETQEMCNRNAENRKKQIIPHTGGSKANSRRRAEMMVETGQVPGRAELYLATHKNVNGAYVNEAAKVVCEKIQQTLSQSTMDESIISPDDAVGKVLGKEHSGRVRCLGLGVVPTRVFKQARPRFSGMNASSVSCPSNCQHNYNKLLNSHNQMMAAFKSYMIMKEGTLPEQFVGLFVPPPTMTGDASDSSRSDNR